MNKLFLIIALIIVIVIIVAAYMLLTPTFTIYSGTNYTGTAFNLAAAGQYPITQECVPGAAIVPFKPKSCKIPSGYKIGLKGFYGNPGDTNCGPTISWATAAQAADLTQAWDAWVYANVNGAVVIQKE